MKCTCEENASLSDEMCAYLQSLNLRGVLWKLIELIDRFSIVVLVQPVVVHIAQFSSIETVLEIRLLQRVVPLNILYLSLSCQ